MGRHQDVVRVYLNNIVDILSGFCVEANTMQTMHATGKTYTTVQSQSLAPGEDGFTNKSFNMAGVNNKVVCNLIYKLYII